MQEIGHDLTLSSLHIKKQTKNTDLPLLEIEGKTKSTGDIESKGNLELTSSDVSKPCLTFKGRVDTITNRIEFFDDFVGSNGVSTDTVPGYPWTTLGSDTVYIKHLQEHAGIWELKTGAADNDQMNLFGGGTGTEGGSFKISNGKDLYFKTRFRITSTAANHQGFFIGLSNRTIADFIDDDCDAYIDGAQSTYGLLRNASGGELDYKTVAHNNTSQDGSNEQGSVFSTPSSANAVINDWMVFEMYFQNITDSTTHTSIQYNLTNETTSTTFTKTIANNNEECAFSGQVAMSPIISIKNGDSTAVTYEIDYILVSQTR